jgi:hypothetical protein
LNDPRGRWSRAAIWCLPVYGALTLAATVSQQPDPATQFRAWSEYVTTSWFYSSHLGASLIGLALGTLGVVGLGVVLAGGRRPRAALTAVALHVLGAAFVLGLFGVAAFVQPAVGAAFLGGEAAAQGWYDAVVNSARTLVPAGAGLLVFSAASVVMAWSLAGHPARGHRVCRGLARLDTRGQQSVLLSPRPLLCEGHRAGDAFQSLARSRRFLRRRRQWIRVPHL